MTVVNIHQAKTHFSRLVERAAAGEEIVIAKAGKPVAKLIAHSEEQTPRVPGGWEGKVVIREDFERLPEELETAFRGHSE
ncbi:MAG: type II toxin-antitoxin system Phd/YefM family antitoxin [Solirubrobacterales bacterium]